MHRWAALLEKLSHDANREAALAAIMWNEVMHWPHGDLVAQLAKNTLALAGIARTLDQHGVRVPAEAIALLEVDAEIGHARA